jgi:hypothetical protein
MTVKKKFPKPTFEALLKGYSIDKYSVHACTIIDPDDDTVNTCAARMNEALLIANGIVISRADIAKTGTGRETDGVKYLLGEYGFGTYANTGRLCAHGVARGAQDLGAFLKYHWGKRTKGWTAQSSDGSPPADISGETGVVLFMDLPGADNVQGHIDLWNKTGPVGSQYWTAKTTYFWQLP